MFFCWAGTGMYLLQTLKRCMPWHKLLKSWNLIFTSFRVVFVLVMKQSWKILSRTEKKCFSNADARSYSIKFCRYLLWVYYILKKSFKLPCISITHVCWSFSFWHVICSFATKIIERKKFPRVPNTKYAYHKRFSIDFFNGNLRWKSADIRID